MALLECMYGSFAHCRALLRVYTLNVGAFIEGFVLECCVVDHAFALLPSPCLWPYV